MKFFSLENYRVKLASILIAVLFWFVIVTENQYEYEIPVRITPVNVPEGKVITNQLARSAKVRFTGHGKALLALRFQKDAEIELDVSGVHSRSIIPLTKDMVHVQRRSASLEILQIMSPDSVLVVLENLRRKTIPIQPLISVVPVPGFALVGGIKLVPDSITVAGPEQLVARLDRVQTDSLRYSDVKYRFSGKVRLIPPAESLHVELPFKQINYFVDVQKLLELHVDGVPVTVRNEPRDLRVTALPSTISLTVVGGERSLMQYNRDDFKAYIEYRQNANGPAEGYKPTITAPDDVEVTQHYPQTFRLVFERRN